MKAFVIKNKEGEYLAVAKDYSYYWTDDIFYSYRFISISESHDIEAEAKEYRDIHCPDCEVVEITIAEGDLEQENKILKECNESLSNKFDKESDMQNKIDVLTLNMKALEQQLAEKEKENKLLRDVLDNLKGDKASQKLVNAVNAVYEPLLEQRDALIRKQVCDEIKREIANLENIRFSSYTTLCDIIDKIDQAKESIK